MERRHPCLRFASIPARFFEIDLRTGMDAGVPHAGCVRSYFHSPTRTNGAQ